jgi:hypothetical protein
MGTIHIFRKKPVIIETVQWTGDNSAELHSFAGAEAAFTTAVYKLRDL